MAFTQEQLREMQAAFGDAGENIPRILIAVAFETVKEINLLRALHSLPPRTKTQVINAIRTTAQNLEGEDD